jgi:hypothetical protein
MKEHSSLIWQSAVEDGWSKLLGNNMLFIDRHDAGKQLAERLRALKDENPVVLVVVGKIGAPFEAELAIGAIADGADPELVTDPLFIAGLDISPEYASSTSEMDTGLFQRTGVAILCAACGIILWFDCTAAILSSRPARAPPARAVTVQDGRRPSRSDAQRPGGSRARWHSDADRDERDGYGREYGIGFGAWSDVAVATGRSAFGDRQTTT